ncbi:alpha-E domain-containing protein [Bacillus sp. AGMB 02131]|uniref:Alpha-E domain-containing protein n=1 Tax=Peribacillus faecalis TaxID=2772559 RepID=A0A927CS64_9BACI|nr:alpha-E domain-containing protein [Peribacillus faecalis]MBD3106908.1 alpha-E domain-containing protein [Peribacillus faecalis]
MLSRVADALYWMARYSERTESNAHILGVQLVRMLEESGGDETNLQDWKSILEICGNRSEYESLYADLRVRKIVDYLAFTNNNLNALSVMTSNVRENARMTRDIIPNELWEVWNELYLFLQHEKYQARAQSQFSLRDINTFLQRIKRTTMTATGFIDSAMTRDEAYQFIKIGKGLERAGKTALIVQTMLQRSIRDGASFKEYDMNFALQLVHGYEDYSKKHRTKRPELILNYLITDRTFPGSVRYGLETVRHAINAIERKQVAPYSVKMFGVLEELMTAVKTTGIEQFSLGEALAFTRNLSNLCALFGDVFSSTYYLVEADGKR